MNKQNRRLVEKENNIYLLFFEGIGLHTLSWHGGGSGKSNAIDI